MAIQGQSFGFTSGVPGNTYEHVPAGYTGAPVAEYHDQRHGGIRWGKAPNRQFQHEHTAGSNPVAAAGSLPENSPLFAADKVTTPLVMMHNDADGAVPGTRASSTLPPFAQVGKHGCCNTMGKTTTSWKGRTGKIFRYASASSSIIT